ncbi:MAG TPA: trypsin-like peptidase domain-containing protein [Bacillales bacterium]|nr:trypsin-like peptidase domain-containing protein [Bacillales bacterium]
MGYYDNQSEPEGSSQRQGRKGSRGSWFWSGLIGAIIGVLVAAFIFPAVGILSYQPVGAAQSQGVPTGPVKNETIKLNVKDAFTKAVDQVSPAIVEVINYQKANFFSTQKAQPTGLGSGIIYKKQGGKAYIVTNNHVVEGATKLEVTLSDNTKVPAELVGRDPLMDLAVITIPDDKVKAVAQFGDSSNLERGEPVIAIGNPLGFAGSVTEGVVSATNRTVPRDVNGDGSPDWNAQVIQTDAAINPGNSGGALINLAGQVIGINSMKIAMNAVSGIGFAIPINVAKPIIQQIEQNGKVIRPYIGIYYQPLSVYPAQYRKKLFNLPSNINAGLVIKDVLPNGPAGQAGVKKDDIIVSINGHQIKDAVAFRKYLYTNLKPGQTVKLGVYRNGKKITLKLTLGKHSST